MNTESVHCNNCGAPLEIPPSAYYATCRHCGSSLAVVRTADVVGIGVMFGFWQMSKARRLESARRRYQRRQRELISGDSSRPLPGRID